MSANGSKSLCIHTPEPATLFFLLFRYLILIIIEKCGLVFFMGFWIKTNVRVTKESDVVLKFLAQNLELIVSIHVSSLVELDLLTFE